MVSVTVAGFGGVPAAGVSAVVMNVTVTDVLGTGYITVFPDLTPRPAVSNLNYAPGQTVANLVTVPVGSNGRVDLFNGSANWSDLIADIAGYYVGGTPVDAGTYVSLTPTRILDTRHAIGAPTHVVGAAATLSLTAGGVAGVPTDAKAVVLNVTATSPTKTGYVTAYPSGSVRPAVSNLNYTVGRTVPNLVTVALGSGGKISLYNGSSGTVNLIADVAGYYLAGTAAKAGAFVPLTPKRILDTRHSIGVPPIAGIEPGHEVGLQTVNDGGVPLTNVGAVVMNVTATAPTRSGYLTVSPTDPTRPVVSNLNHAAGQTIANLAIVPPGVCSKSSFYNGSSGTTQLLADVVGYFLQGDATSPGTPAKTGRSWGYDNQGELGDATVDNTFTPVTMAGVQDIKAFSSGLYGGGNLLVTNGGTVFGWGPGVLAALHPGQPSMDDGYGNCSIPQAISGLTGIVAVAGSPADGYALDGTGHVWSWGGNTLGQLGDGTTTDNYVPTQIPGLDHVIAITGGYAFSAFALKSDGTVWGWGDNPTGELGTNTSQVASPDPIQIAGLSNVTAIAQGRAQFALLADGTVMSWGTDLFSNLGDGSASDYLAHPTPVHVKSVDGLSNLSGVIQISDAMALLSNHTVVTWGDNDAGQLGNGGLADTTRPVAVTLSTGLPNVAAISSSGTNDVALGTDGTVWAWGVRFANGLDADASPTPTQITGLTGVLGIGSAISDGYAILP